MPKGTLTSKGQVTIPKEVRERLGLKVGDQLLFRFDDSGKLSLAPAAPRSLGNLPGLLHHLAGEHPATIDEMKAAVRARARRKFLRRVKR